MLLLLSLWSSFHWTSFTGACKQQSIWLCIQMQFSAACKQIYLTNYPTHCHADFLPLQRAILPMWKLQALQHFLIKALVCCSIIRTACSLLLPSAQFLLFIDTKCIWFFFFFTRPEHSPLLKTFQEPNEFLQVTIKNSPIALYAWCCWTTESSRTRLSIYLQTQQR